MKTVALIANETKFKVVSILITFQAWICFIWKAKLKWILPLHCLGTLQKGDCKWAHQILGGGEQKWHPHWCPELFCMIRPQQFCCLCWAAIKNGTLTQSEEVPSGRNKWRHQCGRTTADLANEAQQGGWKLASGWCIYRPQAHGCVGDNGNAALEGELIKVTIHQPREGNKKNGINYSRSPLFTFSPTLWL